MNVLLDLDGTLTDPKEGVVLCIKFALASLGEEIPDDAELERFIGPPLHLSFDALFGADSPKTARAVALYRERFAAKGFLENRLYPGIPSALAALGADGATLFVATSKPTVFAERIIEHFGLGPFTRAIHGSELDGTRSDKAKLVAHILKAERLLPSETAMVGDREHDMAGAKANGVFAVGALWGYGSRQELLAAGASVLCEVPSHLRDALLKTNPC